MTAHSLTLQADSVGKAGQKPMFSQGPKPLKLTMYTWDFGTDAYTAGGEDISSIWTDQDNVLLVAPFYRDTNTVSEVRIPVVDPTNMKLLMYVDIDTPAESSGDIGFATVDLMVVSY